jgi:putative ABC transport system ATP-binding protein
MIGCLDQPTTGHVLINDKDVTRLNRNQRADMRRGTIGFVFQFFALIPTLSAYENVEMPLLLNGHTPKERKERVTELLKAVDLVDRANNRPDQLSGGQQQRVAVARALASSPALVLADEPTANLDKKTGLEIVALLKNLNEEFGVTLVVATHDPEVASYAGRVIRMEDGEVISDGRPSANPAH